MNDLFFAGCGGFFRDLGAFVFAVKILEKASAKKNRPSMSRFSKSQLIKTIFFSSSFFSALSSSSSSSTTTHIHFCLFNQLEVAFHRFAHGPQLSRLKNTFPRKLRQKDHLGSMSKIQAEMAKLRYS